ncbi:MAG: hypothetical protein ACTHKV_02635 [Flavipsychrobacter sp.]
MKGVGPQRGELLRKELQIASFGDLLEHYPYRYFDRSRVDKVAAIGGTTEYVQLIGTLVNLYEEGDARKKRLTATFYDDTGRIELIWFQNIQWVRK